MSLVTGVVTALVFALSPFVPVQENTVTAAVLVGFALGWAMLAFLSTRLTDQPQRWAWAPAAFMGLSAAILIVGGVRAVEILSWVWPPALLALVIWIVVRTRAQLRSRSRRWLLYPVLAVMTLAAIAGGYQTVQSARDEAAPMAGQPIDIGGHRLYLSCTGTGSPTVVLEPGAGLTSSAFAWIAPAVARDTRVCVYDRAGRGWSDSADTRQDARQTASDLHTLLRRGGVDGPYVLAGHSFGGLYALSFAAQYPDDVAGMVLVDSTAPATAASSASPPDDGTTLADRAAVLLSTSARLGVGRLLAETDYGTLPPSARDEQRASEATVSHLRSTIAEYLAAGASAQQAAALADFGDKPLVVLTAGDGSDASWSTAQDHPATLSANSSHRVVDGASHSELLLDEAAAAATTQAVLDIVTAVRDHEPVAK